MPKAEEHDSDDDIGSSQEVNENLPSLSNRSIHRSHNPTGRNQHKTCPSVDNERVREILTGYHFDNITDKHAISRLLLLEHKIQMSPTTVRRRRAAFGLHGSHVTTRQLPDTEKRQLVLDEMGLDPNRKMGPRRVKELISDKTGIHLTRDYITEVMREEDPEGFHIRHPHQKKSRGSEPANDLCRRQAIVIAPSSQN